MDVSDRRMQVQLTQEAKIASDFYFIRAIFAVVGFISALRRFRNGSAAFLSSVAALYADLVEYLQQVVHLHGLFFFPGLVQHDAAPGASSAAGRRIPQHSADCG